MIRRFACSALVGLACLSAAPANPPQTTVALATTPIIVPAYGAMAGGSAYAPPADNTEMIAAMNRQAAALERIATVLEKLAAAAAAETAQPDDGTPMTFAKVTAATCIQCHTTKTAPDKGGGFAFLDDSNKLLPLRPADVKRIGDKVKGGAMPPPKANLPLGPEAKAAVAAWAAAGGK